MEKMVNTNSELDDLFPEKKRVRNPFVPIGAFLTAGVLTAGLISFRQGNSQLGQKLMRARVVVQGATVALMVGTAYYYGLLKIRFTNARMSSPSKRRDMDVMKLMMSDYAVEPINDGINEFNVEFHGPKESLYEGGVWKVRVELPDAYPYKSPSIGFLNKIFHPNVDELSGSVCLDVINQSWSPMFDLLNVFEVFLPQLLLYPNPSDPLNGDAASLMMKDKKQYDQKVKEYCERYAKKENITSTPAEDSEEDVSDDDISNGRSASSEDDVAGHADP